MHYALESAMHTLQIRELPDEVYEALALRAERDRRSLNQQAIIELARMPEVQARQRRVALARRLAGELGDAPTLTAPEDLIRADRAR
jgi:antitoxin FitA